jgi:hypothetical protein
MREWRESREAALSAGQSAIAHRRPLADRPPRGRSADTRERNGIFGRPLVPLGPLRGCQFAPGATLGSTGPTTTSSAASPSECHKIAGARGPRRPAQAFVWMGVKGVPPLRCRSWSPAPGKSTAPPKPPGGSPSLHATTTDPRGPRSGDRPRRVPGHPRPRGDWPAGLPDNELGLPASRHWRSLQRVHAPSGGQLSQRLADHPPRDKRRCKLVRPGNPPSRDARRGSTVGSPPPSSPT